MIIGIYWSNKCLTHHSLLLSASVLTDSSLQYTWITDIIFVVSVVSQVFTWHACPYKIQNHKSTRVLIWYFQPLTLVTEHKGSLSTAWIQNVSQSEKSICSICTGSSTSQNLSISYIPSEVRGGIYNSSWNLGLPSFNVADQTHLPTIPWSLTEHFLTHLSTFSGAPPPLGSPTRTSLSIKSPPERGEWRKEGAGTLIWLCNTVQFAVGQWNSISFFPPLVNIHLKSLYRLCLPLALSHLYSSSAGSFQWEGRIRLQQERLRMRMACSREIKQ